MIPALITIVIAGSLTMAALWLMGEIDSSPRRWFAYAACALAADFAGTMLCFYVFGIDPARERNELVRTTGARLGIAGALLLNHLLLAAALYIVGRMFAKYPTLVKFCYFIFIMVTALAALQNTMFGTYEYLTKR